MPFDKGKKEYDASLTDVPALDEDFSLEEILAEYGSSREQQIIKDVERLIEPPAETEEPPVPRSAAKKAESTQRDAGDEVSAQTAEPAQPDVLPPPRPISLEDVVGSTVDAVMEERAEPLLRKKRGLFSRRPLEETEQLYDSPAPEEPPEIEPIGPEPKLYEAAEDFRRAFHARRIMLLPAAIVALATMVPQVLELYAGKTIPLWTGDPRFQSILILAALCITSLLCRHVFVEAVVMLVRKRCVSELLAGVSALAAMGDCVLCILRPERSAVTPYGGVTCLALVFAQWGVSRKYAGMYDMFRTAAVDDEPPYLVTDTERGACKQKGAVAGFYTTAMKENASAGWQTLFLPLIFAASVVFAGLSSLGQGRNMDFFLNWSAVLTAGATFSMPLCWGFPFSQLSAHLKKVGCTVAGWSGAEKISRRRCMILTDTDLFPPGTIQLNGMKVFGEERKKVASYAATMARSAGMGLERLFDGLLRSEEGAYETAHDFSFYEEGGCSAAVCGESVLLGTASFMRKMEIRLPNNINLKTGVFLAVDRQLIAVFAVKYNPAENVDFALRMMRRNRVMPVLATRDPNITPALIKRKFHKSVRLEYPDLTSRVALSEAGQDRDLPRALLLREGLLPYAETVVGSRRLCKAVRRATVLSLLGSAAGTLLAYYLIFQSAYGLLTPLALTVFLLLWTLPVLLISDWAGRY